MSLKVWLPLTGTLENKGTSNVTVTNNGATVNASGKIGSCYHFGTASSYMTLPATTMTSFTTACSVTFWLKIKTWNTNYATYFQAGKGNNPWNNYIFGFLRNASNSTVCFTISDGSTASNNSYLTSTLTLDQWYHVALTYTTGKCKIYLNGVLDHEYTTTIVPNFSAITTITIGTSNATSSYQTDCDMNDVRIYDHCLSAAEVREISQGLVLHYKLDSQYSESTTNLITSIGSYSRMTINNNKAYIDWSTNAGDTYIFFNTSEAMSSSNIYSFSFQCDGLSSSEENTISFGWANLGGNYRIYIHNGWNKLENFSPPSNELRTFFDDYDRNTTANFRLYNFQLEKKDHATGFVGYGESNVGIIQDSSGYGHNGTIEGNISLDNNTPRYLSATHFQPSSGIFNNINITFDSFTISFWAKHTAQNKMLMGSNASISNSNANWYWYGDNSFKYASGEFYYAHNAGTSEALLGTWIHFVATYDGSVITVYRNGVKEGTQAASGSMLMSYVSVGNGYSSSNHWAEGYVSDFRIYTTALSADDIYELYKVEAKVDKMKEIHTYSFEEKGSRELIAGALWTEGYYQHGNVPLLADKVNGEYVLTGQYSIGSPYIPISPSGHTYVYDIDISTDSGNVFYIGFERYDANKTSRSNNACVYLTNMSGQTTARTHQHYHGTVDLSTDGVNPCAFIALRILNDWSSPNNRKATIHRLSLREVSTVQTPTINNNGIFEVDELNENMKAAFHKHGIMEATQFIEM